MPTTIDEERLYRDRFFDPYLTVMIWIASIIALFPFFVLLAYIHEGDIGKMATTYSIATGLITIIGSYMFSKTIGYDNFLEKYNVLIPQDKPFSEYFDEKLGELELFKELHLEFEIYFEDLGDSIASLTLDEYHEVMEKLNAFRQIVLNTKTPEEIRRLCNLLTPFSSSKFRGIEIEEIKKLSWEYYQRLTQFQKGILGVQDIVSKYNMDEKIKIHN